jgi:error-prone DNA polymerase
MGFYSPASLIQDAQRHGVEVRPIDVLSSKWLCDLEAFDQGPASSCSVSSCSNNLTRNNLTPGTAVRLGLRFVQGLHAETAQRIEAARDARRFAHVADLAQRAGLARAELLTLAELGALASIDAGRSRRAALWQVAAIERDPQSLFAGAPPPPAASPLPEMSALEETLADYRTSGVSTGPHVMAHLRARLARRRVLSAVELRDVPNGRWVHTAGHVIVRQRPGSAKGMCFLTLEDETGTSNAVLTPQQFRRFRVALHTAPLVEIAGPVQNIDGVLHVRVKRLLALAEPDSREPWASLPHSHDYR